MAYFTGRVAVEFRCSGRWSGISTTEARWWAFCLDGPDGRLGSMVWVHVADLRRYVKRQVLKKNYVGGGDGGNADMVLVPVGELWRMGWADPSSLV